MPRTPPNASSTFWPTIATGYVIARFVRNSRTPPARCGPSKADEDEAVGPVSLPHAFEQWHFRTARKAPRCPEVHQHYFCRAADDETTTPSSVVTKSGAMFSPLRTYDRAKMRRQPHRTKIQSAANSTLQIVIRFRSRPARRSSRPKDGR
jgi:hypothetical protein